MKNLLLFEHLKFWRSRKTLIVLLLLTAALGGMVWYNNSLDKAYWEDIKDTIRHEKTRAYSVQTEVEAEREAIRRNDPENSAAIAEITKKRDLIRTQYLFVVQEENIIRAYRDGTATPLDMVQVKVNADLHLMKIFEEGYTFLDETPIQVMQRLAVNQYLLEHGIDPLNSPYQMVGINFLSKLLEYPWILIVVLSLALLTLDMFSGEFEGGAYKVLYSQPFGRGRIHGLKFLVYFGNSFLMVTGLVLAAFILVSLANGLGDLSYPVNYFSASYQGLSTSVADQASALTFLPWLEFVGRALPLYLLLCCFTIALMGASSFFLTTTANVLNGLFCLLILDFVSRTLFSWESAFYTFWPFTVAGLNNVLEGLYHLSAAGYLLLLASLTVLLLGVSLFAIKRRQMTGGIGL